MEGLQKLFDENKADLLAVSCVHTRGIGVLCCEAWGACACRQKPDILTGN